MLILTIIPQCKFSPIEKGLVLTSKKVRYFRPLNYTYPFPLSPTRIPFSKQSTAEYIPQSQERNTQEKGPMVLKFRWFHAQEAHSCWECPSSRRLQRQDEENFRSRYLRPSAPARLRLCACPRKAQVHIKLIAHFCTCYPHLTSVGWYFIGRIESEEPCSINP